jgi:hypothetical protein
MLPSGAVQMLVIVGEGFVVIVDARQNGLAKIFDSTPTRPPRRGVSLP